MTDATQVQTLLRLTDAQVARIEAHRALLADWNTRINLVGPKELEHFWGRHALDSAQLLQHAPGARRWIDLGSGAGFPGLVIACLLDKGEVTLVEATAKKVAFLRAAIEATGARARVVHGRIEDVARSLPAADIVTARALAPLPRIIELATPILRRGAQGLFLKGADLAAELEAAAKHHTAYDFETLPSLSDPRGRILRVRKKG